MTNIASSMMELFAKTFVDARNSREGAYWRVNLAALTALTASRDPAEIDPQQPPSEQPFAGLPVLVERNGTEVPTVALVYLRFEDFSISIGNADDPAPLPSETETITVHVLPKTAPSTENKPRPLKFQQTPR